MILKLIKKLLHHFNYEVVSYAEMEFLNNAVNERAAICQGKFELEYIVTHDVCFYEVRTRGCSPVCISVKKFNIDDYGSIDYARACAQELCDKLNEKP